MWNQVVHEHNSTGKGVGCIFNMAVRVTRGLNKRATGTTCDQRSSQNGV